ncbi:hypothetical protein DPMN_076936 [Dreissena polymorpha]|uniref:Uncharacterized protein n=1 Tax=Dreissena polymorpha TaxID=45954 RepID=A0A9D3YPL2_DREPO|nr:hypothetical protein DPMN_076936 [Dreissena polymorpha]
MNLLTQFHEDRKVNENCPAPSNNTNLLTKLHEDWTINEKCLASGGHVFTATKTIFELIQDIIGTNLLTKFHDDRKINVTCRVLTRKNAPQTWWSYIIGMNFLTKFHEDQTINVASIMLTRFYYSYEVYHFQTHSRYHWENNLTKFHEDRKKNVASRVLTKKNAQPPRGHVFQPTCVIFELVHNIIGMNFLTKFHDDWTINVAGDKNIYNLHSSCRTRVGLGLGLVGANRPTDQQTDQQTNRQTDRQGKNNMSPTTISFREIHSSFQDFTRQYERTSGIFVPCVASRMLTRFYYSRKCPAPLQPYIIGKNLLTKFHEDRNINVASTVKNAPPPGGHVFQPTNIIFDLVQDIIGMNLLIKFHEDWTINLASRVKNAPPLGSHVFQLKVAIFKLIQDIIGTNFLTKFHDDRKINVASRVLTRKMPGPPGGHVFQPTGIISKLFHDEWTINVASREKCPSSWQPCFSSKSYHFETQPIIIGTNLRIKFHEDRKINVASRVLPRKTALPPGGHVFSPIWTIFELVRDINEINVLTKFHDDWAKNVTSRVFTMNTAPPPGGHTNILTNFELSRGINGTNVLTKFHEDQTINVFTRQNVDDARLTTDKRRSQKLTMSTLCSGELKSSTTLSKVSHLSLQVCHQLVKLLCNY